MATKRSLSGPAAMWIGMYGDEAPAKIRDWAQSPIQSEEAADLLERIAQFAEHLLSQRRGNRRATN